MMMICYIDLKEIDYWKRKDPIEQFEKDLLSMDLMNKEFKDNYIKKISKKLLLPLNELGKVKNQILKNFKKYLFLE